MIPIFRADSANLQITKVKTGHFPPHIHQSLECIYVLKGSLELGIRTDFYHMEAGDFCLVFPGLIHHFQVFDKSGTESVHLLAALSELDQYEAVLTEQIPEDPVITKDMVHPDILYALKALMKNAGSALKQKSADPYRRAPAMPPAFSEGANAVLNHAFFQIILTRSLQKLNLKERPDLSAYSLVDRVVAYCAGHFREEITLNSLARALGVSPFSLSRIFSAAFHANFNQFINEMRLSYASFQLRHSNAPITEIFLDAGFQSQATFNRVFQEHVHMTPSAYRKLQQELL